MKKGLMNPVAGRWMSRALAGIGLLALAGVALAQSQALSPPQSQRSPQAGQATASPLLALPEQVRAAERGFAQSMADRNHAAFAEFVSDEAIFFTGKEPYRGKQQVVAGWQRFFRDKDAPFSWQPDKVEVLASGNLALSTGPVHDPAGQLIAHFTSIWRQEAPGVWRIIFDKGESVSAPATAGSDKTAAAAGSDKTVAAAGTVKPSTAAGSDKTQPAPATGNK